MTGRDGHTAAAPPSQAQGPRVLGFPSLAVSACFPRAERKGPSQDGPQKAVAAERLVWKAWPCGAMSGQMRGESRQSGRRVLCAPAPVCPRHPRWHEPRSCPQDHPWSPRPPAGLQYSPTREPARPGSDPHPQGPVRGDTQPEEPKAGLPADHFTLIVAEAPHRGRREIQAEGRAQTMPSGAGRGRGHGGRSGRRGSSQSGPQASRQREEIPEPEQQSKGKRKPRAQSRGRLDRPLRRVPTCQGRGQRVCRATGKAD